MPRGDGTGPAGAGPGTGQGIGREQDRARMGGFGSGVAGSCICPSCGKKIIHQRGTPCYQIKCPNCGANMTRSQ